MEYRSDIDGLRALAVIPVILFHAGFNLFSGGFVGVDIFFVISGYLITSIILNEIAEEKFNIARFYQRRARRILPVLFFVVLVCIPFACLWLTPHALEDFFQSIIAVATFSSNILFWRESGYFGEDSELKPLLHTWSLAVEEQFYILFPILLILIRKFNINVKIAILMLGFIISLSLAQWGAYYKKDVAFYLLPTRAWELLIGVFVAFYMCNCHKKNISVNCREILSSVGLIMIIYSIFAFDEQTPFPSLYALIPTMGTAFVLLFSTPETLSSRLLSTKPLVAVGLISYSAYLWHQPILAFAKYKSITTPDSTIMAILCIAVLPLAYLSWRFIEIPFRKGFKLSTKKTLFASSALCLVLVTVGAVGTLYKKDGLVLNREELSSQNQYLKDNSNYTVALWGDSFADAFSQSLGEALNSQNISMVGFIQHSCPSILNASRNSDRRLGLNASKKCKEFNEASFRKILKLKPKYIVLTSAYFGYMTGKNSIGESLLISDIEKHSKPENFIPLHIYQLAKTFHEKGITPIIVTPHPQFKGFKAIVRTNKFKEKSISTDINRASTYSKMIENALIPIKNNILFIETTYIFCNKNKKTCSPFNESGEKSYLYYDGSHLSSYGAKILVGHIVEKISD